MSDNNYPRQRQNPNQKHSNQRPSEQRPSGQRSSNRRSDAERRRAYAERRKKVIRNRLIAAGILVVLIIIVIIIIASCNGGKKEQPASSSTQDPIAANTDTGRQTEEDTKTSAVSVINEKPVSLYTMDYGSMTCNRVSSFKKAWSVSEDLESFGAFCSPEATFPFTNETQAHRDDWNSIRTTVPYKIGYELSFDTDTGHKVITIRKPGDIENNPDLYNGDYPDGGDYNDITGYMGVWVYDDMNQEEGAFYIHITQNEVTEDTLLTSIKLRPTPQSDAVSNLVLKAFSYSSDEEFDAEGHYIGSYAYEVPIEKS